MRYLLYMFCFHIMGKYNVKLLKIFVNIRKLCYNIFY